MNAVVGVFVAWPYASGDPHLGNVAGAYLPADIFARYHRLRGDRVLMVSGSDAHGTPVTFEADKHGVPPEALFQHYHDRIREAFAGLGLSFNLYTHTNTQNHVHVVQELFRRLLDNGFLYRQTHKQLFSDAAGRFLPDRYVEGTCPVCAYPEARGDQCDNCGNLLDQLDLIDPRSRLDGTTPTVRETEHFFLDLAQFNVPLTQWIEAQTHWRPNVRNFALGQLREGLRGRAITRDLDWGVPVPVAGWEDKRIYVWFEAVIGYLSAAIEWARNRNEPGAWEPWWQSPAARGSYFIGKDNITFHAIMWPAILMGAGDLNLPSAIPANEYLNLEGRQFSKSRNWFISLRDFLSRYDPDPLRYYLTVNAPETRDTDFIWADFARRNNDELVATWGNLVHRTLTFTLRNFDGKVPNPGQLSDRDRALFARVGAAFGTIGDLIAETHFKAALTEVMDLAQEGNRYLSENAPWHQVRDDRKAAATTLYVALRTLDSLKVLFLPFLPFSSQQLHRYLGYDGDLFGALESRTFQEPGGKPHDVLWYTWPHEGQDLWRPSELPAGQPLRPAEPLVKKLDAARVAAEEWARLGLYPDSKSG